MFERASKEAVRFDSSKGELSTEDLWNLPLTSQRGISLDSIAKVIYKKLKEGAEISFVDEKSDADSELELKMSIVKYIIEFKKDEAKSRKSAANKKVQKEQLIEALAKKRKGSIEEMSEAALLKAIEDLE